VAALSLAGFKARLDGALSTLGWWKMSLLLAGGWNQMSFKVPSNPNHSMIAGEAGGAGKGTVRVVSRRVWVPRR